SVPPQEFVQRGRLTIPEPGFAFVPKEFGHGPPGRPFYLVVAVGERPTEHCRQDRADGRLPRPAVPDEKNPRRPRHPSHAVSPSFASSSNTRETGDRAFCMIVRI